MALTLGDQYFAAYFDGEGTFGFSRRGRTVNLQIRCTDRDILERFALAYGGNVTLVTPRPDNPKQQFRWQLTRIADVQRVVSLWLPYFGERRQARAREALAQLEGG